MRAAHTRSLSPAPPPMARVRAVERSRVGTRLALWDGETNERGRERWKFVPANLVRQVGPDLWDMPKWLADDRGFYPQ